MAITIIQRPEKFTPSGNPIIWQVKSDDANIVYFRAEVADDLGNVINTLDIFPSPDLTDGAFIDLSKLLDNTVTHQIENDVKQFIVAVGKPWQAYTLKVTEKVLSGTTVIDGDSYEDADDINYVFSATFDRINFKTYEALSYVVDVTNAGVRFLSHKPYGTNVNKASSEYLYFIQDGTAAALNVVVRVFNGNGTLNNTYTASVPSLGVNKMYRIAVSPRALKAKFNITMLEGQSYAVHIEDQNGLDKTEERKYRVKDLECHLEAVNIFWVNSAGGIDSYQFVNPVEALSTRRTAIKKNAFRIDDGKYSDMTDNVWNTTEEIINSIPSVKVTLTTRILKDEEVYWLGEMVYSKQCFVEMSDGSVIPVMLENNTYNYQRTKYLQGTVNVMRFTFLLADWIIPALSNGTLSYVMSTVYYNDERRQSFQKQGCDPATQVGTWVAYTVPAGAYQSDIGKADANDQADADIAANGQAYSNAQGTCIAKPQYGNDYMTTYRTKNNCPNGQYGSQVMFSVAENTYYADSKQEANFFAAAYLGTNAQAYANSNGTCTVGVGNDEQSQVFYSTVCANGTFPDPYTVAVAANTYAAPTKAEANQLALNYISNNGQSLANTNGTCSVPSTPSIHLNVSIYEETGPDYVNIYYTVYSMTPVEDNITISVSMVDNNGVNYAAPPSSMWAGSTQSYEQWAGQFSTGMGGPTPTYTITITAVSPNPGPSGTVYTF